MTKRIITYPPKKVVYRNASVSTSSTTKNSNEAPGWLRTRDYLLKGGSPEYQTRSALSTSASNMRSASRPSGEIPYWLGTMMYGTQTLEAESPSKGHIEKSLPYNYHDSDAAKDQYVRSRIRRAAKQMNIATPKPYWLRLEGLD